MARIFLLDRVLREYKRWTMRIAMQTSKIENNILQNNSENLIEQKVASIIFSSLLLSVGVGVAGLFGVSTGGFGAGVVLFGLGWLLSRAINKKIFGTPRSKESLKEDETLLIDALHSTVDRHKKIRDKINHDKNAVHFTDYVALKKELLLMVEMLQNYDVKHLALVYRAKHPLLVVVYKSLLRDFIKIYAGK